MSNPQAWKRVPIEPTEAMVEAGRAALSQGDAKVQTHARVLWVWEAMLSSAPPPPASASGLTEEERETLEIIRTRLANDLTIPDDELVSIMVKLNHAAEPLSGKETKAIEVARSCLNNGYGAGVDLTTSLLAIITRLTSARPEGGRG